MRFRVRLVLGISATALALSGVPALPAAAAEVGAQAYSCKVTTSGSGTDHSKYYANYYGGETVQPSSTAVSAAGKEAQCILKYKGYSPGTVDGIFGGNSQTAAKKFQAGVNELCGRKVLAVDGKVGPATWPYLRQVYVCWDENN
ncbi:peptidoglycan-binding domain-containing protein [Streptomyces parvus]|uniref:peptidoglycan-binding domain-containing protein n=1 Tax=Streptomyces parvus TaxID=66428 RepID=UPI0033DD4DD4